MDTGFITLMRKLAPDLTEEMTRRALILERISVLQPVGRRQLAARLNLPLGEWDEQIHIIPAVHKTEALPEEAGNYVLMKSASHMKEIKEILRKSGRDVSAVIDCGMDSEIVCRSTEEIPDDAGYFSLIIAKEKKA